MHRGRPRLLWLGAFLLAVALPAGAAEALRIGITAVVLQDQPGFLERWRGYLERRLDRPVRFEQRGSYAEVSEMLLREELDLAWVCGAPYVRHRPRWRLVAVPVFRGRPLYRSYLVVRAGDRGHRGYADLRGVVFAYSDPDSNSGYLVPQYEMARAGVRARSLFRKSFFTWAHQDTVRAVAVGLADAGAVDGYIWETLAERDPALAARTRVVARSDWYGFPPIVARSTLPGSVQEAVRDILLGMAGDPDGRALLGELNLDGFTAGDDALFDGIRRIMGIVDERHALRPQP